MALRMSYGANRPVVEPDSSFVAEYLRLESAESCDKDLYVLTQELNVFNSYDGRWGHVQMNFL